MHKELLHYVSGSDSPRGQWSRWACTVSAHSTVLTQVGRMWVAAGTSSLVSLACIDILDQQTRNELWMQHACQL
jgi:hypothetical protein